MSSTKQDLRRFTVGRDAGRGVTTAARAIGHYAVVAVLVALCVVGAALSPGFLGWGNITTMLAQVAPLGIVAAGMTLVILAGGLDISVGAIFAGCGVLYAVMDNLTGSLIAAACITAAAGMGAGLANGLIIRLLRISPFVTTLGTASIYSGAMLIALGQNSAVYPKAGTLGGIGTATLLSMPWPVWILAGALVLGGIALHSSAYGRTLYAIGDNNESARLAGLNTDLLAITTYVVVGLTAAVGGIIYAAQSDVGDPTAGATIPLLAIAAVVVGGTSLFGGRGAMWRTAVGICIFALINGLFNALSSSAAAQYLVEGGIVVVALAIDKLLPEVTT